MNDDEPTLFECEECGTEYNPDEEGADDMCEDCHIGGYDEETDDDF